MWCNTTIAGRFTGFCGQVVRKIGGGGTGQVYLVRTEPGWAAVKFGKPLALAREEAALSRLGSPYLPQVICLDDDQQTGESFLALEYIPGYNLAEELKRQPWPPTAVCLLGRLLSLFLQDLHQKGYIFGDLKLSNIMFDRERHRVRLIDGGGITKIGEGLPEFSPGYDRAAWGAGMRRADPDYDRFALGICLANLLLGREVAPGEFGGVQGLLREVKRRDQGTGLTPLIRTSLSGLPGIWPEFAGKTRPGGGEPAAQSLAFVFNLATAGSLLFLLFCCFFAWQRI